MGRGVGRTRGGLTLPLRPPRRAGRGDRGRTRHDGVVVGAVLNRAAGAVGLTNLFSTTGDLDGALRAAVATANELFPNVAIVGYESGADLDVACRHGFVTLGPLRVWVKDAV